VANFVHQAQTPRPLSLILLDFLEQHSAHSNRVCLDDVLNKLQHRGFGVALFLCALLCMVPMPGPNAILAVPLFIMAPQMVLNRRRLWLPAWVLQRQALSKNVLHYYKKILPALGLVEKLTKARLPQAVPRRHLGLMGVIVGVTAVAIALPLPVPGSNTIPSAALVVAGLGMAMRDGLLVLWGSCVALLVSFGLFGLVFFIYSTLLQQLLQQFFQ
jgi:hypothetical protein